MKSAYELAMERLEKTAPTPKLSESQKAQITEVNSLYGSRIAEKEIFLQGELLKARQAGSQVDMTQIQDQLNREVRRLHAEWEEKKAKIYAEPRSPA